MQRLFCILAAAPAERLFLPAAPPVALQPGVQPATVQPAVQLAAAPSVVATNGPEWTRKLWWTLPMVLAATLGLRRPRREALTQAVGDASVKPRAIEKFAFETEILDVAKLFLNEERSRKELFGREFEVSVLLGPLMEEVGAIPLKELRLRFCDEAIHGMYVGTTRKLEVTSEPWFISMDGKQDVRVTSGGWTLNEADSAPYGARALEFYLDVPETVMKNNVGFRGRLFFGMTLWETDALPKLREDKKQLQTVVRGYPEGENWLERQWNTVAGYRTYKQAEQALQKMDDRTEQDEPKPDVVLGPYTASKEGYVSVLTNVAGKDGKPATVLVKIGSFSIRKARAPPAGASLEELQKIAASV